MNNHAKRLMKELETLGFRRDYDAQTRGIAYRHANDSTQVIKVFDAMSDSSMTAARRMANKIADTGWAGPRMPSTIKERAATDRRKRAAQQEMVKTAVADRAAEADAKHEAQQSIRRNEARLRELRALMMPGGAR